MIPLYAGGAVRERFGVPSEFWAKVKRGKPDECWPWQAALNEKGYGVAYDPAEKRTTKAHRLAWKYTHGTLDRKICVLHDCDNPPCCNPKHLFLGTRGDNNRDMHAKGRGKIHPVAGWNKLELKPKTIAKLGTMSDNKLAIIAGVSKRTIHRARTARKIKSFAEQTGQTGQFQPGHYPARWTKGGASKSAASK